MNNFIKIFVIMIILFFELNAQTGWNPQLSGTTNGLLSAHFIDPTTGWVVGEYGQILKTSNGGASWQSQSSGTFKWLYSVFFAALICNDITDF